MIGSQDPRAEDREPGSESQDPRAEGREPGTCSPEPGAGSRELRSGVAQARDATDESSQ